MGYTIKVINGNTLERIAEVERDHNPKNIRDVAKRYEKEYGKLINLSFDSDCISIGDYENGMSLGFSI